MKFSAIRTGTFGGLENAAIPAKIGKYVTAARRHPAMMIFFRPMRSDSRPKTMKNGVASASAMRMIKEASVASMFNDVCMKYLPETKDTKIWEEVTPSPAFGVAVPMPLAGADVGQTMK